MNILALDLGTKCGWAYQTEANMSSGVWNLKASSSESIGERYQKFRHALEHINGRIHYVVYEEVKFHRATDAAHVYGGFEAILQSFCLDHKIEYQGVGVSTIQKHATGRGMAPKGKKKELMFQAAVNKYKSVNVIDDNHADALCLLSWATDNLIS